MEKQNKLKPSHTRQNTTCTISIILQQKVRSVGRVAAEQRKKQAVAGEVPSLATLSAVQTEIKG